jgi:hypothetical protein
MTSTAQVSWIRGMALLAALLASASIGCGGATASAGVDSGNGPPPGQDVTQPPTSDASDATTAPNDVRSIFGNGDTGSDATISGDTGVDGTLTDGGGTQDGPSGDGGDATVSRDSGGGDTGVDVGVPQDTGTTAEGGVCVVVPVTTDTSGEGTCTFASGGMCGPTNVSSFTPKAHPPSVAAPYKGSCTAAQIDTVYQDCFVSGTGCASTLPCYSCIFSSIGASTWGPAVVIPNTTAQDSLVEMNVGGCLELLEPCNAPCAYAVENQSACEFASCGTSCAISSNSMTITDYDNCAQSIDTCAPDGCATYSVGSSSCTGLVSGSNHPGSICNTADFQTQFEAISAVFCGN